jgi:hypothetical protein
MDDGMPIELGTTGYCLVCKTPIIYASTGVGYMWTHVSNGEKFHQQMPGRPIVEPFDPEGNVVTWDEQLWDV